MLQVEVLQGQQRVRVPGRREQKSCVPTSEYPKDREECGSVSSGASRGANVVGVRSARRGMESQGAAERGEGEYS